MNAPVGGQLGKRCFSERPRKTKTKRLLSRRTFGSGRNNQLLLKSPKWQIKRVADVSTLLRRNNKPKLCALKSQYSTQVDIRLFRAGRKQDSATAVLPFRSIPWAHIYRALQCRVLVPPSEARGEEVRKKKERVLREAPARSFAVSYCCHCLLRRSA